MSKARIILLLCFFPCLLMAQKSNFRPNIGIGVHGGYSFADVYFSPSLRTSALQDFSGGVFINYNPERVLGIQAEVNKVIRGWKEITDTNYYYSRSLNTIEIPLLTHLTIGQKFFRLTIDFGPYISFYQSQSEDYLLPAAIGDSANYDFLSEYSTIQYSGQGPQSNFDYGFTGGLGFGIKILGGDIQFRFRYSQGMKQIFERYPEGTYSFSQTTTFYAGFSYTYFIYFGPKKE